MVRGYSTVEGTGEYDQQCVRGRGLYERGQNTLFLTVKRHRAAAQMELVGTVSK